MKFWFDTEFIEDGKTIDLISIGIIAEDGRTYYAEAQECDRSLASDWVRENVLVHTDDAFLRPRADIASDIVSFVGEKPEFWAYYADYDWVVLCQLYGTMMDLPEGWPMYCRDIKQVCDEHGNPRLPQPATVEHNALADAVWAKAAHEFLTGATPNDQ